MNYASKVLIVSRQSASVEFSFKGDSLEDFDFRNLY